MFKIQTQFRNMISQPDSQANWSKTIAFKGPTHKTNILLVRVWVIFQNGYCHFSFGGMRCVAKWENIPNYIYYSWERMPGKRRLTDSTNCVPTYFGVKLAQNIWDVITLEALVICLYLIYSTKIRKMFSFFQKQKQYYTIANMQKNLLNSKIF